MTETNAGSPKGRESYGDGGLVVVAGVAPCQGGRESRPQGEGGQVIGHRKVGRYARCETLNGTGCPAWSLESPVLGKRARRVRRGAAGKGPATTAGTSPCGLPCVRR